jgi:Zn-dependent peptidase ImmA (M78 family)
MPFLHPGKYYIEHLGSIQSAEDILGFAEFLRRESGVDGVLPVDLSTIYAHFGIPKPQYIPLPGQQGLLVDAEQGIIAINSRDPETRQRFSEAHELAEMLFSILPAGIDLGGGWFLKRPGGYKESTKEFLCNRIAANLLMPPQELHIHIQQNGVSFNGARAVSLECQVSLSAALVQLTYLGSGHYSTVLWRMKNKPTEIKNQPTANQLKLFDNHNVGLPAMKLRVEWSMRAPDGPYIPENKSTEKSSLIYSAWESGSFTKGEEWMSFDDRRTGWYRSENLPFEFDGERFVLSLVEYLHP